MTASPKEHPWQIYLIDSCAKSPSNYEMFRGLSVADIIEILDKSEIENETISSNLFIAALLYLQMISQHYAEQLNNISDKDVIEILNKLSMHKFDLPNYQNYELFIDVAFFIARKLKNAIDMKTIGKTNDRYRRLIISICSVVLNVQYKDELPIEYDPDILSLCIQIDNFNTIPFSNFPFTTFTELSKKSPIFSLKFLLSFCKAFPEDIKCNELLEQFYKENIIVKALDPSYPHISHLLVAQILSIIKIPALRDEKVSFSPDFQCKIFLPLLCRCCKQNYDIIQYVRAYSNKFCKSQAYKEYLDSLITNANEFIQALRVMPIEEVICEPFTSRIFQCSNITKDSAIVGLSSIPYIYEAKQLSYQNTNLSTNFFYTVCGDLKVSREPCVRQLMEQCMVIFTKCGYDCLYYQKFIEFSSKIQDCRLFYEICRSLTSSIIKESEVNYMHPRDKLKTMAVIFYQLIGRKAKNDDRESMRSILEALSGNDTQIVDESSIPSLINCYIKGENDRQILKDQILDLAKSNPGYKTLLAGMNEVDPQMTIGEIISKSYAFPYFHQRFLANPKSAFEELNYVYNSSENLKTGLLRKVDRNSTVAFLRIAADVFNICGDIEILQKTYQLFDSLYRKLEVPDFSIFVSPITKSYSKILEFIPPSKETLTLAIKQIVGASVDLISNDAFSSMLQRISSAICSKDPFYAFYQSFPRNKANDLRSLQLMLTQQIVRPLPERDVLEISENLLIRDKKILPSAKILELMFNISVDVNLPVSDLFCLLFEKVFSSIGFERSIPYLSCLDNSKGYHIFVLESFINTWGSKLLSEQPDEFQKLFALSWKEESAMNRFIAILSTLAFSSEKILQIFLEKLWRSSTIPSGIARCLCLKNFQMIKRLYTNWLSMNNIDKSNIEVLLQFYEETFNTIKYYEGADFLLCTIELLSVTNQLKDKNFEKRIYAVLTDKYSIPEICKNDISVSSLSFMKFDRNLLISMCNLIIELDCIIPAHACSVLKFISSSLTKEEWLPKKVKDNYQRVVKNFNSRKDPKISAFLENLTEDEKYRINLLRR